MCRLFTKPLTCRLSRFFKFVAVKSFTADSSLLQPTGAVNAALHTSYFRGESHAHAWLKFGSALIPSHLMLHGALCVSLIASTSPFTSSSSSPSFLSYHSVLLSARQLHLPGCGGQIPCALPPIRTLAPLPSTTLSHILERAVGWNVDQDLEQFFHAIKWILEELIWVQTVSALHVTEKMAWCPSDAHSFHQQNGY